MTVKSESHTAKLVKRQGNIAMFEIIGDDGSATEHRFFVVEIDGHRVKSAIPADCPNGGVWCSYGFTAGGIAYVANGRTRKTAQFWFRKLVDKTAEMGGYY